MGVFNKKSQSSYNPFPAPSQPVRTAEPAAQSRLGKTLQLKGELLAKEEVLVEGKLEGTIKSDGIVVIGKAGRVTADIFAREIVIKGEVNGNVTGSEKVEIVPMGVLNGNIISKRVVLAEGAIFKGNIDMSIKDAQQKKLQESNAAAGAIMKPQAADQAK